MAGTQTVVVPGAEVGRCCVVFTIVLRIPIIRVKPGIVVVTFIVVILHIIFAGGASRCVRNRKGFQSEQSLFLLRVWVCEKKVGKRARLVKLEKCEIGKKNKGFTHLWSWARKRGIESTSLMWQPVNQSKGT
jgi:hypothetical protein